MHSTTIATPVGPFTIVGQGKAVLAAGFTDDEAALTPLIHPSLHADLDKTDKDTDLGPAADAVRAYFNGDLRAIDTVEVRQHSGGDFMTHAWQVLRTVRPGVPTTYTDFAAASSRPTAVRAVATACARNAAALFVPCHRIVRTDGSLGGYRWGLDIKRWLLTHEGNGAETRS